MDKKGKEKIIKQRVKALENASTVLEWTIAVRMAKWNCLGAQNE